MSNFKIQRPRRRLPPPTPMHICNFGLDTYR